MPEQLTSGYAIPVTDTAYLDNLQAYTLTPGLNAMLDQLRIIQQSGAYFYQGIVLPGSGRDVIPALTEQEENITIEPGTMITMINAGYVPNSPDATDNQGFRLQIYDVGGKTVVFNRTYGKDTDLGIFQDAAVDVPRGGYLTPGPMIVLNPGTYIVKITNLCESATRMQVFFQCAVPISRAALSQNLVEGETQ